MLKTIQFCLVFLAILITSFSFAVFNTKPKGENKKTHPGALPPKQSSAMMKTSEDLHIDQVLSEPIVAQPVFLNFDERGRMWVVQYLQYPHPAGLKIVSRDSYWRAVYDKIPLAPPNHVRGRDKITIHEDTNGDGNYDKHKTFIDGLNIVTSIERGRGGVWVLNPPYLMFYPDKNNDDIPDGDPVVHLAGFGLEDTHSVANSLRWGPDGWLYAAQGSTVTGKIIRPGIDKKPVHSMGQLIWRYHPQKKIYEIFAEGGGNAFGCEIDSKGRLFSGHNGGNTRGFHYTQGGYLQKGFSKHGPLSNPYAFGYFSWMKHHPVQRFTHNFVIYDGASLPRKYNGKLFGVEPLQGRVVMSDLTTRGSTFQTKDISHPMTSSDKWFRPVDIKVGPDGAIYVADWYDGQVAHTLNSGGNIDPTNGRIYRLQAKNYKPRRATDLSKFTTIELINHLKHPNRWHRQTALRLIADRHDKKVIPLLKNILESADGQHALEALWALNLSGGLNEPYAKKMLSHRDPFVRLWTVRLICDKRKVSKPFATAMTKLAGVESNVEVRSQLASSAKRLPTSVALPMVQILLKHREDLNDPYVPLLLWWAIESKCEKDRAMVLKMFEDQLLWEAPLVQKFILQRLVKRFAKAGTRRDLLTCADIFRLAPNKKSGGPLMKGFEQAFKGRSLVGVPEELFKQLSRYGGGSLTLKIRQKDPQAITEALAFIINKKNNQKKRLQYIHTFGEVTDNQVVPKFLQLLRKTKNETVQTAILTSLQAYRDPEIGKSVVQQFLQFSSDVKLAAQTLLASRAIWSKQLLKAVDQNKIKPDAITLANVRKIRLHQDQKIQAMVKKHWGALKGTSTAKLKQQITSLTKVIQADNGSPYKGKALFKQTCAKCHRLFEQGGEIGPDLTSYKRDNLTNMLTNIVIPSAEIREGYENFIVMTDDGRQASGYLVDQDNKVIILRGADGQNIVIQRDEIENKRPAGLSLMPEGLLDKLTAQQVRDLFAYLRSTQPLNDGK